MDEDIFLDKLKQELDNRLSELSVTNWWEWLLAIFLISPNVLLACKSATVQMVYIIGSVVARIFMIIFFSQIFGWINLFPTGLLPNV